ncbi:MAG: hypothetical protein HC772_16350 [Leptolyngbyaceae cyanobacterium CRU_2_3]|nr:hypothetical protein [Leptolyngbyaceae cyanobacterium CRU_2_3]
MINPALVVPDAVTFEQAIALTQALLTELEQGNLSEAEIQAAIAALVQSKNGGRGFFVTYLTDERSLADQPSEAVVSALQSSPTIVAELLVKNLVMSSAMAITHRRHQNEPMAQGSDRVRQRSAHLIQKIQLPEVAEIAQQLQASAATGTGEYQEFLDRWGYDAEQRHTIEAVVKDIL